ncbi:MAG: GNAT family N-acetyltransferase [Armatimonadota bacterium]
MHLAVRPALPDEGTALMRIFDAAYVGGYSPTFDRDGSPEPGDIWWVHSEKDVSAVEVDHHLAGLLIVGRAERQWIVEEMLLPQFGTYPAGVQEALVTRMTAYLVSLFQRAKQRALVLRAAETNAFALAMAHGMQAAFANALLVFRHRESKGIVAQVPEGYRVRKTTPADAPHLGRLVREIIADRPRADEIERVLGSKDGRGYLAQRDALAVGFAAVELREGRGDWMVGVRETHRRRGVGRALAAAAATALRSRGTAPFATAWALDPVSGSFLRSLGFSVERTYLYMDKPL